jgi:hypothetical protein
MAIELIQKSVSFFIGKKADYVIDERVFGAKIGLTASILGCWHIKLTRPFMDGKVSYQTCLHCGARKPFNSKTLKNYGGGYYYSPVIKSI